MNPAPENDTVLASRSCRITRFIHENHIHTFRRIFPTLANGAGERTDAAIIDNLH